MIRNINDLTENELIEEFENYYRHKQFPNDSNPQINEPHSKDNANSFGRSINSINSKYQTELVNESNNLLSCPTNYIRIGQTKIKQLIDTGTNLNIISATTYEKLKVRPQLCPTKIKAYGFNSKLAIPLKGEFQTTIWFKQRSVETTCLVLDGEADNILGFSATYALGTIKIDSDEDPTIRNITEKFAHPHNSHPELFTGRLGLLIN